MIWPSGEGGAAVEARNKAWWDGNPEIDAARNEAPAWLQSAADRPLLSEEPDPVVMDVYSGACRRELAAAREDHDRPRARYAEPFGRHA
jgi:hypothetical protein